MKSKSLLLLFSLAILISALITGCGAERKIITEKGLRFSKLGGEMPPAGARRHKGLPMHDSLAAQGEYTWRVAVLRYKGGNVVLEEDFFTKEMVNRIRIETPELQLRNGLAVGHTVNDLTVRSTEWYIVPLREYKLFDFYCRMYPGIHFLVDDPAHSMEDEEWEKYKAPDFNPSAKIVAIVVY